MSRICLLRIYQLQRISYSRVRAERLYKVFNLSFFIYDQIIPIEL